jgi:superfamily II DNA or RNA helicase
VKDALEALEGKKEYLILAMSQCVGEGFDVPALEIGIQTFSTSRELVLEQII